MHFQSCKQILSTIKKPLNITQYNTLINMTRTILGAALWHNIQRAAIPKHTDDLKEKNIMQKLRRVRFNPAYQISTRSIL